MGRPSRSVPLGGKPSRKREPNGNRSIALTYIQAQCGSLFRRGFSLVAHREKLYVRAAGTKIPLFLDLSASWQDVQRRAALLQEELEKGAYDPDEWRLLALGPAAGGKGVTLRELDALWRQRKEAEGIHPNTYERDHARYLRRLDPRRPLSAASLMRAIAMTKAGSPSRVRAVNVYRNAAKACGQPWNGGLLDPLVVSGYRCEKKPTPLFTDQEIEAIVLGAWDRGDLPWWRILALMAIYGLRPWEAWYAEPSTQHEHCAWIPIGKRNSKGANPPREVPPFHRHWIELFRLEEVWRAPMPPLPNTGVAGNYANLYLKRKAGVLTNTGKSSYGFRNSYARRIHSAEYRVTDGDGAAFMGHTVVIHNAVYRRWVAGFEDPIARYL